MESAQQTCPATPRATGTEASPQHYREDRNGDVTAKQHHESQPIQGWPREEGGKLCAAVALELPAEGGGDPSRSDGLRPWRLARHLGANLHSLPPPGVGSGEAWRGRGRYGRRHGAQCSRNLRGAFRRADDGRGVEHSERPPRCRNRSLFRLRTARRKY